MGMIRVQNVSKEFGGRTVLDDISVDFNTGQTVGLVGANGSGKTTLFRMITGELEPDIGTVTSSKGLAVGLLRQEPAVDPNNTLLDEVAAAFDELRRLEARQIALSEQMAAAEPGPALDALMADYDTVHNRFLAAGGYAFESRLHEILGGLGFTPHDYNLPMSSLSGGQQCRAALARLLLEENTFLLLDEPTNHLDLDAVAWLEKFLAGHQGGAVIISHDRYLLDRVADRIVELDRAKLHSYPGNYTNYAKARATRELSQQRQFEQDQAFIAKEREFINKHMGKQRTAEAKGRLTRLERRLSAGEFVTEAPQQRKAMNFGFKPGDERGPRGWVADVQGLSKAYDAKRLFADLDLRVQVGARLGVTGPNGTGKSTLLKILLGELEADAGTVEIDSHARVGYYAQDGGDLDPDTSLVDQIRLVRSDLTETHIRSHLGRFRFSGDEVFKPVRKLSGGERSRLRLLKLILDAPNLLVLDEPTNHLDIPAREALEAALRDFPGAIIVVSHDRYFLDSVVDRLLVIRPDDARVFTGNYSDYAARREAELAAASTAQTSNPKQRRRPREAQKAQKKSPFEKMSLEELETQIMAGEARAAEIEAAFGDSHTAQDVPRVEALRAEYHDLRQALENLQQAWDRRVDEGEPS